MVFFTLSFMQTISPFLNFPRNSFVLFKHNPKDHSQSLKLTYLIYSKRGKNKRGQVFLSLHQNNFLGKAWDQIQVHSPSLRFSPNQTEKFSFSFSFMIIWVTQNPKFLHWWTTGFIQLNIGNVKKLKKSSNLRTLSKVTFFGYPNSSFI